MASRYVFLSYNKEDETAVREIAAKLEQEKLKPWLDIDRTPGRSWQDEVEEVIRTCRAAAVFVGQSGIGPWEQAEMRILLSQFVKRDIPVIPVLLPGSPTKPELPLLLEELTWVELQEGITQEGINRIIRGITRKRRRRSSKSPTPTLAVPLTPEDRLLDRVKKDWVRDVLDAKVPEARWIDLKMEQRPGEVERPGAAWRETVRAPSILSEGEILNLFRDQGCSLLILGDTGAGKTTALLLLARSLILARQSPAEPIPVYLHLSSWSQQRRPFGEWLIQAMGDFYNAEDMARRSWIPERILPLLDGLDEVEAECQAACVSDINAWLVQHGLSQGMAVCCHSQVYKEMSPLKLAAAVVLQPLTENQIEKYAAAAGAAGETLRATLAGDEGLRELARTPQLLHLIEENCKNEAGAKALAESAGAPLANRRQVLLAGYVDAKLESSPSVLYPRERILSSMGWLAWQMKEHSTSLFQFEKLQPTWLPKPMERWAYFLGSRALAGMLLILPLALILRPSLILSGLVAGALVGIFDAWAGLRRQGSAGQPGGTWQGLVCTLLSAIIAFSPLFLGARQSGCSAFIFGPLAALLFGLVLGLRGAGRKGGQDIQVAEALTWSWGSWNGVLRGASTGGLLGLLPWLALLLGKNNAPLLPAVQVTGFLLLAGALVGSLLGGVKVGTIPRKSRPNLGIWLTLQNAAVLFLAVFLATSLAGGAVVLAIHWQWPEIRAGLPLWSSPLLGLLLGFWIGLGFSGLDFLQHFVLRALLRLSGYAPSRYVQFLDYAAEIGLLHRAGGSYLFSHGQPLLEHFAACFSSPSELTSLPQLRF